jgi:hypothetical protein
MRARICCLLVLATLLTPSCTRPRTDAGGPAKSTEPVPPSSTATQAVSKVEIATDGESLGFQIKDGVFSFCDKRGARNVDLKGGQESPSTRACPKNNEPNNSCENLGLDISVRSPMSEPNDIVDIGAQSYPVDGRVHDCSADRNLVAVATGSAVAIIDVATGTMRKLNAEGGDHVLIGGGWIAWSEGPKLHLEPIGEAK